MSSEPVVFVISGDSRVRSGLLLRLRQLGCRARACQTPADLQEIASPRDPGCVLLQMGRVETELAWLAAQARREAHWPVIGIAAEADLETAVRAMKQGAFDFLLESCASATCWPP